MTTHVPLDQLVVHLLAPWPKPRRGYRRRPWRGWRR